jgi:hypothetical protein
MADSKSTSIVHLANPEDDGFPRMVSLFRASKELVAVGAADGEDAARQVAILVLKMEGGLRVGNVIQITRIWQDGDASSVGASAGLAATRDLTEWIAGWPRRHRRQPHQHRSRYGTSSGALQALPSSDF